MESYLKNKNILVLGAHSDDEVLGLGGMILSAKKLGSKVTVLIATDSVSEQYANVKQKLIERDDAFKSCCEALGVDNFSRLSFPDMKLDSILHVNLNKAISKFISDQDFDTVFVHHPYDINLDHRLLFESILVVARPTPNQKIKSIITYYTPSSTEWNAIDSNRIFVPNMFLDIEGVIDEKISAILKYESEIKNYPHPRSVENIKNMAAYFGSQVGLKLAEPFKLIIHVHSK